MSIKLHLWMMKVPHVKFQNTYIELRLEGLKYVDANGHSFHCMKERRNGKSQGPTFLYWKISPKQWNKFSKNNWNDFEGFPSNGSFLANFHTTTTRKRCCVAHTNIFLGEKMTPIHHISRKICLNLTYLNYKFLYLAKLR